MATVDTHGWAGGTPVQGETSTQVGLGSSLGEAGGGIAALCLAIVGLAGVLPMYMTAIGVIVVGVAILLEGGAAVARHVRVLSQSSMGTIGSGSGLSAEFVGGVAGIVLGILSLLNVAPAVLLPVAAIVFGGAVLLASGSSMRMGNTSLTTTTTAGTADMTQILMQEAATAAAGSQVLVGLASVILGILGVVGIVPYILTLVALLCLGASILLSGAALSGKMTTVWNR